MTRSDYLWVGIKLLGLWLMLLAIGAVFPILEAGHQLILLDMLLEGSLEFDDLGLKRTQAQYIGTGLVGIVRLSVYGFAAWYFLGRTSELANRLSGESPAAPAA